MKTQLTEKFLPVIFLSVFALGSAQAYEHQDARMVHVKLTRVCDLRPWGPARDLTLVAGDPYDTGPCNPRRGKSLSIKPGECKDLQNDSEYDLHFPSCLAQLNVLTLQGFFQSATLLYVGTNARLNEKSSRSAKWDILHPNPSAVRFTTNSRGIKAEFEVSSEANDISVDD